MSSGWQNRIVLMNIAQLIRTEFQPFIENEQAILGLVSEMADLLESIAVNPHHTPGELLNLILRTHFLTFMCSVVQ
jgi:hypothetical protein